MQSFSEHPDPSKKSSTEPHDKMDLQAKRALEDDWHKSNAEKLVAQLIAQGPENPGPLNPHTLAIKALSHMRDLSPHYLYRFISYIDTLLWLDKTQSRLESQPRSKHSKKT